MEFEIFFQWFREFVGGTCEQRGECDLRCEYRPRHFATRWQYCNVLRWSFAFVGCHDFAKCKKFIFFLLSFYQNFSPSVRNSSFSFSFYQNFSLSMKKMKAKSLNAEFWNLICELDLFLQMLIKFLFFDIICQFILVELFVNWFKLNYFAERLGHQHW